MLDASAPAAASGGAAGAAAASRGGGGCRMMSAACTGCVIGTQYASRTMMSLALSCSFQAPSGEFGLAWQLRHFIMCTLQTSQFMIRIVEQTGSGARLGCGRTGTCAAHPCRTSTGLVGAAPPAPPMLPPAPAYKQACRGGDSSAAVLLAADWRPPRAAAVRPERMSSSQPIAPRFAQACSALRLRANGFPPAARAERVAPWCWLAVRQLSDGLTGTSPAAEQSGASAKRAAGTQLGPARAAHCQEPAAPACQPATSPSQSCKPLFQSGQSGSKRKLGSADQQAAPGRLLRLRKGPPGEAPHAGRGGEADTQLPSDTLSLACGERAQPGACARPPLQLASPCAARRRCSSGAVASRAAFCQQSNRRAAQPRAVFSTAPLASGTSAWQAAHLCLEGSLPCRAGGRHCALGSSAPS